jgi:hypothetical protein
MRKLILIASLALASCGGNQQANNSAVAEESSAADIGPVNDTTAIDAATGEAANIAADVNYTFNEESPDGNGADTASGRPRSREARPAAREPDGPASESAPAGNTAAPSNTTSG